MSEVTEQILFSGRVQGVGFRWTTEHFANDLQLSGFVRNLPDGRVEAVVAGSGGSIQKLVDRLRERFGDGIRDVQRHIFEHAGAFEGFAIGR